jgi:hypothetical protein
MTDSKSSQPPESYPPSSLAKLRYCLHRDAFGEYDCGIAFLSPYPNRLCMRHRMERIRLPMETPTCS